MSEPAVLHPSERLRPPAYAVLESEGSEPHLSLWLQWHATREPALREELVSLYLPHARMLAAKSYARRTHDDVPFSDYYQLASLGLLEAVDRFDPLQGIRFEAYCSKRIVGAVLNGLEAQTEKTRQISVRRRLREERLNDVKLQADAVVRGREAAGGEPGGHAHERLFDYLAEVGIGVALGVLLEDTGMIDHEAFGRPAWHEGPEAAYFRDDALRVLREAIRAALTQLPQNQQLVIEMHYLQGTAFVDIAALLQLTKGRVSQLHKQALLHLRERLRPPCDFDRLL